MEVIKASILSLIFSLSLMFFDVKHFLFFLKASHANSFLLFMSSSSLGIYNFSNHDLMIYLLSIILFFSGFTSRFLSIRAFGTVFFIYSFALLLVVIQDMSSAYCWSITYNSFVIHQKSK